MAGLNAYSMKLISTDGLTEVEQCGGAGTFSGTSVTITDAKVTASSYVSIFPIGTKLGIWTVNSTAGSFTITSTKSETSCAFKWSAIK